MFCGSASSSRSCSVAFPTFSGCRFLTFFSFFLMYCLTYFFFLSLFSSSFVLCVAGYLFFYGLPASQDMWVPAGLFFSPWCRHCHYMAWCLGSLSLPYFGTIDIVWCGPASLVPGILQLSGSDVDGHCGIAVHVPWFSSGCFMHLPPTLS